MTMTIEALEAQVLSLSGKDRARLLDRLIESLDADAEVEAAWDALAEQRSREIDSGAVKTIPLEEVLARLEERYPG